MKNNINLFFDHIKGDRLEESIQFLQKELLKRKNNNAFFLIKEINDALIVISSELTNLNKHNILGIIERNQYTLERNKIVSRLIKLGNKYNSIKLSDTLKPVKYSSEEIQKTLYLLENKFDPTGIFIKTLKNNLLGAITDFFVDNIAGIFIEIDLNKISPIPIFSSTQQITDENLLLQEFEKRIINWLDRPETLRHIYLMINKWSELHTSYIEGEIKYVYKMHGINPDEFWSGYHIIYPEIKINSSKWGKTISNEAFDAFKRGGFLSMFFSENTGGLLYLGYKLIRGENLNNPVKSSGPFSTRALFLYDFIRSNFKSKIQKEVEQNIYIQKSINIFSDDWILNNVVLQFEYLRLLNQSR